MNLQNLIDYGKIENLDIFSGVSVPDPLDADTVKSAIMIRCGLLTPVYSEPEVMRAAITYWFTSKQWTLRHLINVIQAEYSPIENYDRHEEWTEAHTGTQKNAGSSSNTGTQKNAGSSNTENTVSAYNSSNYQPDNNEEMKHEDTRTDNLKRTDDFTRTDNLNDKHTGHLHGNIGVTTNQDMINQELELLRHFDIYSYIAKLFEEDLCLMIY